VRWSELNNFITFIFESDERNDQVMRALQPNSKSRKIP
jgi:hypothetical protein